MVRVWCYSRAVEWLNYHHLLYFWMVAREGSVARASEKLRLAQPTLSGQIRRLEEQLGEKLFARSGRGLVLTDVGRVVYGYADEIFGLGRELMETVRGRPTGRPGRLVVGVSDWLAKLLVYRVLQPALRLSDEIRLVCHEGRPEALLAELALHNLDVVLSDSPVPAGVRVRAFSHLLGECGVTVVASPREAARLRRRFPESLTGAPMLLPGVHATLRRGLDDWLERRGVRPRVVAEFDDSALLSAFGQETGAAFPIASAIEAEARRQYGVAVVGRIDEVRERVYAITVERKIRHPAVQAISEAARARIFN